MKKTNNVDTDRIILPQISQSRKHMEFNYGPERSGNLRIKDAYYNIEKQYDQVQVDNGHRFYPKESRAIYEHIMYGQGLYENYAIIHHQLESDYNALLERKIEARKTYYIIFNEIRRETLCHMHCIGAYTIGIAQFWIAGKEDPAHVMLSELEDLASYVKTEIATSDNADSISFLNKEVLTQYDWAYLNNTTNVWNRCCEVGNEAEINKLLCYYYCAYKYASSSLRSFIVEDYYHNDDIYNTGDYGYIFFQDIYNKAYKLFEIVYKESKNENSINEFAPISW